MMNRVMIQVLWMLSLAGLLAGALSMPLGVQADSLTVKPEEGERVEHDGELDAAKTQETQATVNSIAEKEYPDTPPAGATFEIKSVLFEPPTDWSFVPFFEGTPEATYVDIIPAKIDDLPADALPDESDEIRVWWFSKTAPTSADDFSLRAEGNLKRAHSTSGSISGTKKEHYWAAVVKTPTIDLDVDSDNNDGFDPNWSRTPEEDGIEADTLEPGRVICVNDNDNDEDRIPDFADGFDLDGTAGNADDGPPTAAQGEKFVPIIIEIGAAVDLTKASLRFVYSDSDPAGVVSAGTEPLVTYTPATGHLRVWTKPGHEVRKKEAFNDTTDAGHFVPSTGASGEFDKDEMAALGFSSGNRTVTLHVEGIAESSSKADQSIAVTLFEDSVEVGADLIRMTVIKPDIDVDTDHSGTVVDDDDDKYEDIWVVGHGGVILNNCDDDLSAGSHDNSDTTINGADDLKDMAKLSIQKQIVLPTGWKAVLTIDSADNDHIRIFDKFDHTGETARVGSVSGGTDEYEIPDVETGSLDYALEGLKFADLGFSGYIPITIEIRDASDEVHGSDLVLVRIAPYMMLSHKDETDTVYVTNDADGFLADLAPLLAGVPGVTIESYSMDPPAPNYPDQWIQDEIEIGYASMRGITGHVSMHVVLDSPRNGDLVDFPEDELLGANFGHFDAPGSGGLGDFGGNIEITPKNATYPRGRIYLGQSSGLSDEMAAMLAAQSQQTRKMQGTVSSATGTTLVDDAGPWTADEWTTNAFTVVKITGGKGKGQIRHVTANTDDTLTVAPVWTTQPDERSLYAVSSLLTFDTEWLGVKHADEVVTFNRDGKLIAADPALGLKVITDTLAKTATGTATGGGAGTLTHAGATWAADEWEDGYIYITGGVGEGQIRRVTGNTATAISVTPNWNVNPAAGSTYKVYALSDSGQSTKDDNTATTLEDTGQSWDVNDWQGGFVAITDGAMDGQVRQIASNTAGVITVSRAWDPVTDTATAITATASTVTDSTKTWEADTWIGAEVEVIAGPGTGQTRDITDNTGDTLTVTPDWTTQPYATDGGTAEAGGLNTLTDNDKSWTAGQWTGGGIEITAGTGSGQKRDIASNTDKTITTTANWTTTPDATSVYSISRGAEIRVRLKHPNKTSEYEVTNRGLWRGMHFEGDEDSGISTSSEAAADVLVDSTKTWAADQYNGGVVMVYRGSPATLVHFSVVSDTLPEKDDNGDSTGATNTTIVDSAQAWAADEWEGAEVEITDGLGKGQKRQVTGNTGTTLTVTPAWTTNPFMDDSGTAESGGATTLTDNDAAWQADQWSGAKVEITGGTGAGQEADVTANTATTLTVSAAWTTQPDATSVYTVTLAAEYTVTLGARLELSGGVPGGGANRSDRYVVMETSRRWLTLIGSRFAATTVYDLLTVAADLGKPGTDDADLVFDNMRIYPLIWSDQAGSEGIVEILKNGAAVPDTDVIGIPGLWAAGLTGGGDVAHASAFVPGFVNLLYVTAGAGSISIMPKSFGPYDAGGDDVYESVLDGLIPGNKNYVDDWDLYHRLDGEVHCGTNTKRDIPGDLGWYNE